MSLYLRKDTGKWIVVFYDENGKRRQRSFDTGENGRKTAEAFDVQMKNRKINSIQGPSVEGEDLDGAGQVEASTDADNQSGPTDTVKSIPSTTGQTDRRIRERNDTYSSRGRSGNADVSEGQKDD